MQRIKTTILKPWVSFLIIGGIAWLLLDSREKPVLLIAEQQLAAYIERYERESQVPLSEIDRNTLRERFIDDAVLVWHARELGFHLQPQVQQRLRRVSAFLGVTSDKVGGGSSRVLDQLQLLDHDPIVRNLLINMMQQRFADAGQTPMTEAELVSFFEKNLQRYSQPGRVEFWHVFLGDDAGDAIATRLTGIREKIVADGLAVEQALQLGQSFVGGHRIAGYDNAQLKSRFGSDFVSEITRLDSGRWSEPLRSPFGWHLVYVTGAEPARQLTLAESRDAVVRDFNYARRTRSVKRGTTRLRNAYVVIVE